MKKDLKYVTQDERERLYEELWIRPVPEVAKSYEMSEATLRKHLKRLMIPLPPRGYWEKVKNGESVNKTELPPVKGILKKYVRNYVIKYRNDIDNIPDNELLSKEELNLFRDETKEFIIENCSNITVSNQLRNPHRLISEHKEEIKNRAKKAENRDLMKRKAVLPIHVSHSNINRAYRILYAIIKTLDEMEGHTIVENRENHDAAYFFVMYAYLYFEMNEKNNKLILSMFAKDWFSFNSNYSEKIEFKDLADLPLEKQVGKIVYRMFVTANRFFANCKLTERREDREREVRDRKEKLEEMRKGELEEVKQLTQVVPDWDKARKIRKFADDMELRVQEINDQAKKEKLLDWLKWARDKADWIDPLTEKEDELLGKNVSLFDQILKAY